MTKTMSAHPPAKSDMRRSGLAWGGGRPLLLWSSPRTPVPLLCLQEPSGDLVRWTTVPWTEAASVVGEQAGMDALWVLEPDPVNGPSPSALARTLQNCAGQTHTLVLAPEVPALDGALWLDAGADRCMPANSPPDLTHAMVHAMLRRCKGMAASVSMFGPLRFDHVSQTLFHGDRHIWLTCRETQVAAVLFRSSLHRTHALELLKALGAQDTQTANKALVALYVHRVNRKIRPHGVQIDAIRGFGYSLRLLTPGVRQAVIARPSANSLTQWLCTAPPAKPGEAALRP